jgi:hypothetical protein
MHWWTHPKGYSDIVGIGTELLGNKDNCRVVSIGHSPYWVCKAAQLYSERKKRDNEFVYLPFSSKTVSRSHKNVEPEVGIFCDRALASAEEISPACDAESLNAYKGFLKEQGLEPRRIVADYQETRRKTHFVDYVQGGEGLASITQIMLDWAREEKVYEAFKRSTAFHALSAAKPIERFIIADRGHHVRVHTHPVEDNIFLDTSRPQAEQVLRVVPSFGPEQWKKGIKPEVTSAPVIEDQLAAAVDLHIRNESRRKDLTRNTHHRPESVRRSTRQSVPESELSVPRDRPGR